MADSSPRVSLPILTAASLSQLRTRQLEVPSSRLLNAPETILQLGWGKFLRGFTPDFVQLANENGHYHGRILAVQRKSDDRASAAARQGSLYTLILRGIEDGRSVEIKRVIGSVSRVLVADRQWEQVKDVVRNREMRVIVTNATETGLQLDPADRFESSPPASFPGKVTQLAFERWTATKGQDADIAVIPTELVLNNGPVVHQLLFEQARAWNLGGAFEQWLINSVHVASTLVDRIVVGTPHSDLLAHDCEVLGYRDDLLTCGEPYYLFAIQGDEFVQRHFPMHIATPNVRFVDDLGPYRRRKLRLLNGPQMVLSTLGTLLEYELVREVVKDEQVNAFTQQTIWNEIIPAMGPEEEKLNAEYGQECYQRIGNPTIEHRLQGIRMDLTTKNAIRLFPSIHDFMDRKNALPKRLLLTVAATLAVALKIELQDVNAAYIAARWSSTKANSRESVLAFTRDVLARFSDSSHEFLDIDGISPEVCDLLRSIRQDGIRSVLAERHGHDVEMAQT
jgi:tagaturonate reductase